MTSTEGKVELRLNGQATARMLVVAFVVGGAVATALFAALKNTFHIGQPLPKSMSMDSPYFGLFLMSGTAIAALSFLVVKLRQPRGARIEWNDWGVTEWDGDSVRCAIPRAKLRAGTLLTRTVARTVPGAAAGAVLGRDGLDGAIGGAITLGDEDGRRIYVGEGVQLAWLNDRLSTVRSTAGIRKALAGTPGMPPELGRNAENRLVGVYLLGIIAYVTAILAAMIVINGKTGEPLLLILLAAAALFGALRAWVPRFRAWRLKRSARRLTEPLTLTSNEGPVLVAQTADGATVKLDTTAWKHPDGAIEQRRGEAWMSKEGDALETNAVRRARQWRIRALRLESWGRLLLPAAALALLAGQLREFEKWKPLAPGVGEPVKTTFVRTYLLRSAPAGVEMVYETGKKAMGLTGPAEVLVEGPDDTVAFQTGGVLVFRKVGWDAAGWDLNHKTPLPRAKLVASSNEMALIVTDTGEGQLWKNVSIDIDPVAKLGKPVGDATTALVGREKVFVGMKDGSVEVFSPSGEPVATLAGRAAPVIGLAAEWNTLAVADGSGVTFWDVETKSKRAGAAIGGITAITYGAYPDWMHEARSGLIVLTSDGVMHAVGSDGVVKRRFTMNLPPGEHPACVTSNPREVLVGTDRGGLYELWIR